METATASQKEASKTITPEDFVKAKEVLLLNYEMQIRHTNHHLKTGLMIAYKRAFDDMAKYFDSNNLTKK